MTLTLGIDVGTTTVKAAIVRGGVTAEVVTCAEIAYPTTRPRPGWAEQAPEDWWNAIAAAVRATGHASEVAAIAVSGQGSTVALADRETAASSLAIGWQDRRADPLRRTLDERLRLDLDRAHGNLTGDAPEPRLAWMVEHAPEQLGTRHVAVSAAGWVTARLTATPPAINEADAGTWMSWDRGRRRWDPDLVAALGLAAWMPPVRRLGELAGGVSGDVARVVGVRPGVPVFVGVSDVAAVAFAMGAAHPGAIALSKGTGGFTCFHLGPLRDPKPLLALPLGRDGVVQLCGAVNTVGAALDWCRKLVGGMDIEEAEQLAAAAPSGASGCVVLPWLEGAAHPFSVDGATGLIAGVTLTTSRGDLLRAVMEGTSAQLGAQLAAARRIATTEFHEIFATGGPTRSPLWNRLDAGATGLPVRVVTDVDAAVGSALLAAEAAGVLPDADAAGAALARSAPTYAPEPELVEAMASLQARIPLLARAFS